jgi:hypothetical protein
METSAEIISTIVLRDCLANPHVHGIVMKTCRRKPALPRSARCLVLLLSCPSQHKDANLNIREMTEKELAALGRVVTKSAVFENTLDWAIPLMTKIPDELYALVSKGKTLGPKVELLEAILTTKAKKTPHLATVKSFLKNANKAVEKRNVVVHGLWSPGGHGDSLWIQLTVDLKNTPIAAASTRKKLKVYASELSVLADAFEKLDQGVRGAYWDFFVPKVRKKRSLKH